MDGDGIINVNDLLTMLSAFGTGGAIPEDINGDNVVNVRAWPTCPTRVHVRQAPDIHRVTFATYRNAFARAQVNDLLQVLSNFGADLTGCSGGSSMAGASDGTEAVNCCGGGAACGFQHCPALGDGQDGCVQPWSMPNGMNFETDCGAAPPSVEAPLWCPESPPQMCRMMCPEALPCPAGQCNLREGSCCASSCQAFVDEPAAVCAMGVDCGGQVWNECGTSCPSVCGQPAPMMCNMMCNAAFQCPDNQCFNEATGTCESSGSGNGIVVGVGVLPPDLAIGRPFMGSAKYDPSPTKYDPTPHKYDPTPHKYDPTPHKYDPTPHSLLPILSSAVAATSDWMTTL